MHISTRETVTWTLVVLFTAAIGVGEGWHLVPGNGHFVELPGGYLGLGVTLCRATPAFPGWGPALDNGRRETFPRKDEGDCVICRLSAQGQSRAETVSFVPAAPLVHDVRPAAFSVFCEPILPSFQARAPPRA